MLTPELIKEIAPHANADYVKSLTSEAGWAALAKYKIIDRLESLAGFLANCLHETGGLVIKRESLNYKTPKRLRQVWPSRFGSKSDEDLLKLCGNEKALAALVYSGRMGNRAGTDDGYTFRGAGYLQTTGRENFVKYGKLAGIDFAADPPPSTDDTDALLVMSAAEWAAGRCNELCQGGNFPGACAVINVGSASRVGSVVGMAERQKWFKLITHVFSQYENVLQSPVPPPSGPNDPAPHESMNWPRLRRRPPGEHRWYDVVTRWFRPREEPIEIPAVIAHPELAEHNTDAGDPTFRHDTDRRD